MTIGNFVFWAFGEGVLIAAIVFGALSIAADLGSEWAKVRAALRGGK